MEVCKCFGLALEACTCFGFALEACNYFDSEVCKHFGSALEADRYFDLVAGVHNYCFGFEACRYSDFEGVAACNCWCFDFVVEDTKYHLSLGSCKEV